MKECHVCFYMCDDEAELCPLCGAELKSEVTDDKAKEIKEPAEPDIIKSPVLAASVDSPVTAEIFKDILAENGIPFSADSKGDVLHTGFGGSFFAIDIYVDEDNLEEAQSLYRNLTENEIGFYDFEDEDGE